MLRTGYFVNISALQVNNLEINGSLIPDLDNSFDLGNSSYRWRDILFSRSAIALANDVADNSSSDSPDVIFRGKYDSNVSAGGVVQATRDIKLRNIVNWNSGAGDYRLAFLNDSNSEFVTFVGNTGRVGIGTTTPQQTLDVVGSINTTANLYFNPDVQLFRGAANRLDLASGDSLNLVSGNLQIGGTTVITSGRVIQAANGTAAAPAFSFSADTDNGMFIPTTNQLAFSTAGLERVRIDSSGNVGIATTTPQQKLHVNGSAVFNGTINMDNNKIINLANGTSAQDAVTLSQLQSVNSTATNAVPQSRTLEMIGTANQISVTPTGPQDLTQNRQWTFSLPQDINTTSSPTFAGLTLSSFNQGSLIFAGANGVLSQNNAKLFWNNTTERLGINTSTPQNTLNVVGDANVTQTMFIGSARVFTQGGDMIFRI
ncbi:MAG: hypothetical protein KatS3mg001_103 [Candidatus Pacearchaeota archaeon]|nr:MAG: hypothetical protein KatS3mg001_103 [Candidatus Pacearchaeota archaeon]